MQKKKSLNPSIPLHDLKNVVAGLVAVPKIKTDDKAPIRNHLKINSVPKAKIRRESPKKGKK
jgi:hypothetical protein